MEVLPKQKFTTTPLLTSPVMDRETMKSVGDFCGCGQCFALPSLLSHCLLCDTKIVRLVKILLKLLSKVLFSRPLLRVFPDLSVSILHPCTSQIVRHSPVYCPSGPAQPVCSKNLQAQSVLGLP